MPSTKALSAASETLLESEEIRDGFCLGCEAIRFIPATPYLPAEILCPAEGDPADHRCARKAAWDEIVEHLEEVERLCNL